MKGPKETTYWVQKRRNTSYTLTLHSSLCPYRYSVIYTGLSESLNPFFSVFCFYQPNQEICSALKREQHFFFHSTAWTNNMCNINFEWKLRKPAPTISNIRLIVNKFKRTGKCARWGTFRQPQTSEDVGHIHQAIEQIPRASVRHLCNQLDTQRKLFGEFCNLNARNECIIFTCVSTALTLFGIHG